MRLKIQLIPETAYGQNLRTVLSDVEWRQLSRIIRNRSHGICCICGKQMNNISKMDAHEVWQYKKIRTKSGKIKYVQQLKRIEAVCRMCHRAIHIGHASRGKHYDKVVDHFMKVNHCGYSKFKKAEEKAYQKWRNRSKHKWKLDVDINKIWEEYVNFSNKAA